MRTGCRAGVLRNLRRESEEGGHHVALGRGGFECQAVHRDNQDFQACQSGEVAHQILGRAAPMGPLDNKNGIGYCKGVGLSLWRFA